MKNIGKTAKTARAAKAARIAWALGGFIVVGAATVVACGPDFPLQLLDNRAGTLKNTPANSFAWEAAHLVAPVGKLQADEGSTYEGQREDAPGSLRMREKGQLDDAQFARLKAMRAQPDGEAAYAAGAGLPAAVRLYTAGAQDYRAGGDLLARAQQRFEAVLALPAEQASERAVWAAYMLGRLHAANLGAAGKDGAAERKQAIAAYEKTRALALAGAADPLGLAVASYGEQARLHLFARGEQCGWNDFSEGKDCVDGIAPADLKEAIRLYAQQAAQGSAGALSSLQAISFWALQSGDSTAPLIDDALARRLLVAYALARMGDIVNDQKDSVYAYDAGASTSGASGFADAARGDAGVKPNPVLSSLVDALRRRALEGAPGADRVAALAYRTGRYDLAQALAQKQDTALSWWLRAKLALRSGDNDAAAQAYARALQSFPRTDGSLEPASAGLLMAEQGVFTLSRGQYVEALDQFRRAARGSTEQTGSEAYYYSSFGNYVNDMSYVAERVLTVDELKTYIDARVPASPMPAADAVAKATRTEQGPMAARYAAMSLSPPTVDDRLRQLLARRLVREGRVEEALPYFPDERDERFVDSSYDENGKESPVAWRTRAKAREYGQALDQARHAWRSTRRAEGWYRAALIARRQGMEIMGYEQGPDYAAYGGSYPFGAGRDGSIYYDESARAPRPDTPLGRAQADLVGPYITDGERRRYADSEARPYKRFHYRDVAAGYTLKAADELPARSQAFAAVLCQGTGFVFYDAPRAAELYRRYVKEGAAVPFAVDFGQNCVEPDFAAAARFPYVQAWRGTRRWVSQHRAVAAAALLAAALAAGVGAALYRRRRKPSA
ncbi:hypothetical protein [Herbaspirillum robiniae]|uniref:Cellulose synthase n=1 Tax=Herbaspirillum robiniae TaxID=2014887 RepID=A0ABX2LZE5_9BURK|nr:hypothetical protein [Herbaspirillum robiniae]NUU02353.1 hypothetical protein [Herbaspirillum robiniae]